MRRTAAVHLTAVLLVLGLVTACGSDDPESTPETSSASVDSPTVMGGFGEAPTVAIPAGKPDNKYVAEVVDKGDGAALTDGQFFIANYGAYLWPANPDDRKADDEPLFNTFDLGTPQSFTLTTEATLPGMVKGLTGATVGSRVLLVLPPEEGFGEAGQADMGVGAKDTLVFVFDILDSFAADAAAEGTAVTPEPGLPTVAEGENGPTATIPATAAPTDLISQVLIKGAGEEVQSGQLLAVHYRGSLWKDGTEFDSSWTGGSPTAFPIGVGGVIPGWDKALVGQTVGSRVLLVVPPAEGYGEGGNPPTIAGDDTLVFIVDILGAYGEAPQPTETPSS